MGKHNYIKLGIVEMLDEALSMGLVVKAKDVSKDGRVDMDIPPSFPKELLDQLTDKNNKPQLRLLCRVRTLSKWLSDDYQLWWEGKSPLEGDQYGELIDLFVNGDQLLRFVYDFEGCVWGEKGCSSVTGYAPVLCEGCANGK
jgi:hypothetical protein